MRQSSEAASVSGARLGLRGGFALRAAARQIKLTNTFRPTPVNEEAHVVSQPRLLVGAAALASLVLLASAGTSADSLSLRHGRYVDVAADCSGAPSSASSWFGGGYVLQSSHAHCEAVRVERLASDRFHVVASCYESSDARLTFRLDERIRLIGHHEYELENRFGRTHARWCPA